MTPRPLEGKRVVVTRPPDAAAPFAARLRELGAEPVLLPTISIRPPQDSGPLDRALARLDQYDWLIFTSANAVEQVWKRLEALGLHQKAAGWPPIAAIGPATAGALAEHALAPALLPERHVAEALADSLAAAGDWRGKRVLLPQGNLARPLLADSLRAAGAEVDAPTAYENVRADVDRALLAQPIDAITFTSPSTAQNFAAQFDDPAGVAGHALVVCIGPITADAVRACGLPVHIVAEPHTAEGLIAALCAAFARPATERDAAS
jgi:uroporphyrinogen III methyltransferase/synthase